MTEHIEIGQQRGEELAVAISSLLQRQARSDIPSAANAGIRSGRDFRKYVPLTFAYGHCPVDTCNQWWWIVPMPPAGAPVDATTVQAAIDDHVREVHPDAKTTPISGCMR
jgi:hypothetical protein